MKSGKGCLSFLLILVLIVVGLKILSGLLLFTGILLPVVGLFLLLRGHLDRALQKLGGTRFKLNRIHGFVGIIIISILSLQIGTSIESLFETENTSNVVSKVESSKEENDEIKVEAESEEDKIDSTEKVTTEEKQEEESSDITTDTGSEVDETDTSQSLEDKSIEEDDDKYMESDENYDSGIVYWTPKGKSYHSTDSCSTLSRSKTIYSGTQAESGKYDPCDKCN